MSELEFLQGEALIAAASAPKGVKVEVRDGGKLGRYDILVGGRVVARFLEKQDALACIMGVGGAFAVLAGDKTVTRIVVIDRFNPRWKKNFRSKRAARQWIMEGIAGTEGAEQEHYTRMLIELEGGARTLHYN